MKSYKNYIGISFLICMFVLSGSVYKIRGQNTMDHDKLNDLVFRKVKENCTTDYLLNLSNAQSTVFGITNEQTGVQRADDWLLAYNDMNQSYISTEGDQTSITDLYTKVARNRHETEGDVVQYPLGIIFQDYNYVDVEQALESQRLSVASNGYTLKFNVNPAQVIRKKTVFTANVLVNKMSIYEKLRVKISQDFVNSKESISAMDIYHEEEHLGTFSVGDYFDVQLNEGNNEFLVKYISSDNKSWTSTFVIVGETLGVFNSGTFGIGNIISTPEETFYTQNINGASQSASVKIFYGCNNNEQKVKKPAIMVSGYNPVNIENFVTLTTKFNTNGYLDELHKQNYDVIIVRFSYGADRIENQALLTKKIVKEMNIRKFANQSYFENIITGYSSGALVARMALKMMEKDYEASPTITRNHHSRLLISYDGEHNGANVPLCAQHSLISILQNPQWYLPGTDVLAALEYYFLLSSPLAKDFLVYHYSQTGNAGSPGQDAHPYFYDAREKFADDYFYRPAPYDRPGDYPILRNVGISDGAAAIIDHPLGALPNNTKVLEIDKNVGFLGWNRHNAMEWRLVDGTGHKVFKRVFRKKPIFSGAGAYTVLLDEEKHVDNSSFKIDGVQGSTVNLYNGIRTATKITYLQNSPVIDIASTDCFLPTASALDINTAGFEYDLRAGNLLWDDPYALPGMHQAKQYGYPSLYHGSGQYSYTPFDAIYAAVTNVKHGAGSEDDPETPLLTEFMLSEVQYEDVWLQFRDIGINGIAEYYPAKFEAPNSIVCGENVTFKTQKKPVIIRANADVEMKAGEYIMLEPGTTVEFKGELLAHIEGVETCSDGGERIGYWDEAGEDINEAGQVEKDVLNNSVQLSVYPNPSDGLFTITGNTGGNHIRYEVINTKGIQIQTGEFSSQEYHIDLSKEQRDVYFLRTISEDQVYVQKLILQ